MKKPIFAITAGDPCGIGPEIVVKALIKNPDLYQLCLPVILGQTELISKTAHLLKLDCTIRTLEHIEEAAGKAGILECMRFDLDTPEPVWGKISASGGRHAFAYIKAAIDLALGKKVQAIVTAPINKEALKLAGVPYLDHTEILTKLTSSKNTMTLFVTGDLRVFFYSRHIRFRDISAALNQHDLVNSMEDCQKYLRQMGIPEPKLALAALNPHGGEQGMFGEEETEILFPAVEQARKKGLNVFGPIPADSVFHLALTGHYDAVLSLYHDQGHIATKTLDFHRTVALTMGLPFLRTSVDHGTAFDIAGKGMASEISLVEAMRCAEKYYW